MRRLFNSSPVFWYPALEMIHTIKAMTMRVPHPRDAGGNRSVVRLKDLFIMCLSTNLDDMANSIEPRLSRTARRQESHDSYVRSNPTSGPLGS